MTNAKAGGNLTVEGFFDIYRDWLFTVRAAVSDYGGGTIGAYPARRLEPSVTRRF